MNARGCLRVYNRLTARFCDGSRVFPRKATATATAQCVGFLKWCATHGIDPERFIRARHDAVGWRFRIPLDRLHQVGQAFVDNFTEWGDGKQAETQLNEDLSSIVVHDTNRNAEITVLSEQAKTTFKDTPWLCLLSSDITLGWNPASQWCRGCELAIRCKSDLPKSVIRARQR